MRSTPLAIVMNGLLESFGVYFESWWTGQGGVLPEMANDGGMGSHGLDGKLTSSSFS